MAEIVVRRKAALWQDRGRNYRIVVDGKDAGTVANGAEARISLTPGRHTVQLKIDWCSSPPVEVDVDPVGAYVLEGGSNVSPFLGIFYITFWKNRYLWLRDGGSQALRVAA
jgi:hypothetical protein